MPGDPPTSELTSREARAVVERLARLITHYWRHHAWLGEDELVRGAERLAGIPGVLIQRRADLSSPSDFAWRVHRAWRGSELVYIDGAGHDADAAMSRAVVTATDRFRHR
jgi:proline iminopeptidase